MRQQYHAVWRRYSVLYFFLHIIYKIEHHIIKSFEDVIVSDGTFHIFSPLLLVPLFSHQPVFVYLLGMSGITSLKGGDCV